MVRLVKDLAVTFRMAKFVARLVSTPGVDLVAVQEAARDCRWSWRVALVVELDNRLAVMRYLTEGPPLVAHLRSIDFAVVCLSSADTSLSVTVGLEELPRSTRCQGEGGAR